MVYSPELVQLLSLSSAEAVAEDQCLRQVWCKRGARCVHRLLPGMLDRVRSSRFAARAGGGQVLGAFLELQTKVDGLLFEVGDLGRELVDVGWGAES